VTQADDPRTLTYSFSHHPRANAGDRADGADNRPHILTPVTLTSPGRAPSPSPANPEADELLNTEPLTLLIGMLLDQHMQ